VVHGWCIFCDFSGSDSPEREAVTIVAGFKSGDGVVLCADTQETAGNLAKRNVPKLRFEPSSSYAILQRILSGEKDEGLAVAFCGATDNGPFLDMLIDEAWKATKESTHFGSAFLISPLSRNGQNGVSTK
jgi:hypothetical protein